jgi:hypothetical protein
VVDGEVAAMHGEGLRGATEGIQGATGLHRGWNDMAQARV